MHSNFQLRHVPWMTVTLFVMVCSIHLLTRWFNDPEAVREMYGIDFGNAITYISHAFIHADMFHITGNTVGLLIFGSVAEAQIGRRWYGPILLLSILAGSVGALLFHEVAGARPGDRVVGLSAAVSAFTIVGIGAFACHWGWWKGASMVTLGALGMLLLTALARLWDEGQGNFSDIFTPVLLLLAVAGVFYSRNRRSVAFHRLIPMYWVFICYWLTLPPQLGLLYRRASRRYSSGRRVDVSSPSTVITHRGHCRVEERPPSLLVLDE